MIDDKWAVQSPDAVAAEFGVDPTAGLDPAQAAQRQQQYGRNELPAEKPRSVASIIVEQFRDVLIYLLGVAAVISVVVGEPVDAAVIVLILVVNAAIGTTQAVRADQALAALHHMAAPRSEVVRGGEQRSIPSVEVVPGDILLLEAGEAVTADARLLTAAGLQVAEAALTGESVPVLKSAAAAARSGQAVPVADQTSMVFRGTDVVAGRGSAVVVATGGATVLGGIAHLVASAADVRTPLQRRLASLSLWIAVAVVAIAGAVFVAGILRGEDAVQMLLTSVSLAVAAVPEALPAVVAITLALGAAEMAKDNALAKRLPAVETLGSVTYICSDKTGTLTENRMHVDQVWTPDGSAAPDSLALVVGLSNDATRTDGDELVGDPTETALLDFADAAGFPQWPREAEAPFDSQRMRMTTVNRSPDGALWALCKGAPEQVLPRCRGSEAETAVAADAAHEMAASGLRVLAAARRRLDGLPADPADAEEDLELVGLVGMIDPPRPAAEKAVAQCVSAGIVPVMITGDHPATASAVARRVGIPVAGHEVMTGVDLDRATDEELHRRVADVRVYARVDPAQKIRIVRALQDRRQVVSMTGDGVNDAPALKQADIGVAMGAGGTDVARGAADLILLDNNFATIVTAVREGRRIYDNIRRFVRYTMTSNSGEIWTIFLAPFLGLPLPLLPLQILWINLVTDGLPGLALVREKAEPDVMQRPPRPPRQSIFADRMGWHIVIVGLVIGGLSLTAMAIGYFGGSANWQSMVFTTLVLSQLVNAFVIRSERRSIFQMGFYSNPMLLWTLIATFAAQMAVVYWAPLQSVFRTTAMSWQELTVCIVLSLGVLVAVEAEKLVRRRLARRQPESAPLVTT